MSSWRHKRDAAKGHIFANVFCTEESEGKRCFKIVT